MAEKMVLSMVDPLVDLLVDSSAGNWVVTAAGEMAALKAEMMAFQLADNLVGCLADH